jgi:hypothetical protein
LNTWIISDGDSLQFGRATKIAAQESALSTLRPKSLQLFQSSVLAAPTWLIGHASCSSGFGFNILSKHNHKASLSYKDAFQLFRQALVDVRATWIRSRAPDGHDMTPRY